MSDQKTPVQLDVNEPNAQALNLVVEAKAEVTSGEVLVEPKKLLRKMDLRLIPLIVITYALQSIDKTTLGTAAVFGIRADTNLKGQEFSWLSSLFFLGFFLWEYPIGLFLQKFPVGKVLSISVTCWGTVLMFHAACHDFSGLAAVRTFLGAFESACNPAVMIIFGMWYTRTEQPLRMGIWIGSAGISYIIGGLISYGIGHISGSLASWRLLFLIYGAATVLWGIVLWFVLPDSPLSAKFLSEDEKKGVLLRIRENNTGLENETFKKAQESALIRGNKFQAQLIEMQFVETLLDIKTWLFFFFSLFLNSPNGAFINFQGIIIKSLGFTSLQTTLIQLPSGAVQFVACVTASYLATKLPNTRCLIMILFNLPFCAGLVGLRLIKDSNPYGRLASLWLCFFFAAPWPIGMALVNANTAGHTKRVTNSALLIIAAGLGSFIGSFFFRSDQEPHYILGFTMMFVCFAGEVACIAGLLLVCWLRNRERSRNRGNEEADADLAADNGFLDLTDRENLEFKYVY